MQSIRCLTTAERTGAQLWKSQGLLHLQVNHTKHWAIRDQGELYIRTELDKMTFPWPTSSQTSTISACNSLFWSCLPFCPRQGQLPSISSWTWNSRPFIQIAFGGNKDTYLNIHLSRSYAGHSIHHCKLALAVTVTLCQSAITREPFRVCSATKWKAPALQPLIIKGGSAAGAKIWVSFYVCLHVFLHCCWVHTAWTLGKCSSASLLTDLHRGVFQERLNHIGEGLLVSEAELKHFLFLFSVLLGCSGKAVRSERKSTWYHFVF